MGSLIQYSGISTKIRAMERWRIKPEQFEKMAALESVPEAVRFLRSLPPYDKIFSGVEDKELHRGRIEQLLNLAQYQDFASLYQFANMKQRRFLDLYFMHYEIGIVKTCLRNGAGHCEEAQELLGFKEFFDRHSSVDLERLSQCRSIDEVIAGLKGTIYYGPLENLRQKGQAVLPACETAVDMLYFKTVWKIKEKYLSGQEKRDLTQCFGTRMDMLNLQWICRAKKYYHLPEGEIYAMIIPISLHLKKTEIRAMAQAEDVEQVYGIIQNSWYGRLDLGILEKGQSLEGPSREVIDRIYELTSRKEPYSASVLNSYLYFKEREIEKIITTIERVRYGVAAGV